MPPIPNILWRFFPYHTVRRGWPVPWPGVALLLVLLVGTAELTAQRSDLKVLGRAKRIELPFTLENDFIVLSVVLNNVFPLRFIVDTGAENTVLLEKEITDLLAVDYRRKFEVQGSDLSTVLTAYLATGINLQLAGRLLARNRSMLVLEENYFDFERITGVEVQGILGADFLMRFTAEFDFRRRVLILHEPQKWKPSGRHRRVPADFVRNRAFLNLPVGVISPEPTNRRVLLDSGAGLTLLLHQFPDSVGRHLDLPQRTVPTFIANGLGGNLRGNVGRASRVTLAERELTDVVTYFQPVDSTEINATNRRDGILGNRILRRFNVVVNYTGREVWMAPERGRWRQRFRYDRSGLSVVAGGPKLKSFTVANVIPGSPGDEAGLRVGDRIVAVNGTSTGFMTLSGLITKLQGKVGRTIKLRYKRLGDYRTVKIRLRELI